MRQRSHLCSWINLRIYFLETKTSKISFGSSHSFTEEICCGSCCKSKLVEGFRGVGLCFFCHYSCPSWKRKWRFGAQPSFLGLRWYQSPAFKIMSRYQCFGSESFWYFFIYWWICWTIDVGGAFGGRCLRFRRSDWRPCFEYSHGFVNSIGGSKAWSLSLNGFLNLLAFLL